MKTILKVIPTLALAVVLIGCGESGNSKPTQTPDPASQPEAQAAIFQRMCDRVKVLLANQQYEPAQEALNQLKNYKLTPEQQKLVDELQARIPKAN